MTSRAEIDAIRRSVSLPEIVREYTDLRRSGARHVGLCPMHAEKTPSLSVWGDHFKCFGCGQGGDVFRFLMEMERVTFGDALKMVADRAGIKIGDPVAAATARRRISAARELQRWRDDLTASLRRVRRLAWRRANKAERLDRVMLGLESPDDPEAWELVAQYSQDRLAGDAVAAYVDIVEDMAAPTLSSLRSRLECAP